MDLPKKTPATRLTAEQLQEIKEILDQGARCHFSDERRVHPRYQFCQVDAQLKIQHPGGTSAYVQTATRNLSAGGAAFIYWGFLYPDTRVILTLRARSGNDQIITGRVVTCRHTRGPYHIIGMKFDHVIDPTLFFDHEKWVKALCDDSVGQSMLYGAILLLSDDEQLRELIAQHLANTRISIHEAITIKTALRSVKTLRIDGVICDDSLNKNHGHKAITELRHQIPTIPIIALAAEHSNATRQQLVDAGADYVIFKPFDDRYLRTILAYGLSEVNMLAAVDSIPSEFGQIKSMVQMIETFLAETEKLIDKINQCVSDNDLDALRVILTQLECDGKEFGYPLVTEAAIEAINAINASYSIEESHAEISHIIEICRKLIVV